MTYFKKLGFTLIELVITIVLLGLLSAIALPRFLDLSLDAKRAAHLNVIAALNASFENYKLLAQFPLTMYDPIQPSSALSPDFGPMRALDARQDNADGTGTLLFFSSKTKLVGGATSVTREVGSNRLMSEDPSKADNQKAAYRNLNNSSSACVPIFNILLSSSSVRAVGACATPPAGGGAINGGAKSDSSAAYQSFCSGEGPGPVTKVVPGNFVRSTPYYAFHFAVLPPDPPPHYHGACVYVRTDTIESTPVLYIYYDATRETFVSLEATA